MQGIVQRPKTGTTLVGGAVLPSYKWQRFWCPREGAFSLADGGFLYDPKSEHGRILNPNVVRFEDVLPAPCLILLGEPGMGKSYELAAAKALAAEHARQSGDEVLAFDLKAYQTDQRLCWQIFDSQEFRRWREGSGCLHLFLDSLDECLLRIETVAALLEDELGRCPIDRLRLRIACRTADWPHTLEQAIRKLWPSAAVEVLELVPLRRQDVEAAASVEGIDAASFVRAIVERSAMPLAIKPVTLKMLINFFRRNAALPVRQADLYEQGCLLLCDEPNPARREAGLRTRFAPTLLLAVASRIAAVTVFGNRYAVWTDSDQGQMPLEDVAIRDLCGGTEMVDGQPVSIQEEVIREAVATGLFSSRGPHRMGWAHQTYAEFLAARYLVQTQMAKGQIASLLVHPQDPQQRIVPQLHEAAAWVASLDADSFDEIMTRDPVVLLRSDVAAAAPEDRQRLIASLLPLFEQEKLRDSESRGQYGRLGHPGLPGQLRPYIRNRTAGWLARRVAIDIAEACNCQEVVPDLLTVLLDQTEELSVRVNAAYAVVWIGDSQAKAQLRPLALGQAGEDPNDDLKGCGLRAAWPDHMTAEEFFMALTPPKRENYGGAYSLFLFELRKSLLLQPSAADLRFALNWVARGETGGFYSEEIREEIMLASWKLLLEHPDLATPFAQAAMTCLRDYRPIAKGTEKRPFSMEVQEDHVRRRALLTAGMQLIGNENDLRCILSSGTPLVMSEDLPWLASQLALAVPEKRPLWAQLMEWVCGWQQPGQLDIVLDTCARFPDIAGLFPWLKPVEVDSPEGRKTKATYLKYKRLEERSAARRNRPLLDPPPIERVKALLVQFESGDRDAWWHLNMEMMREPDSRYYGHDLDWDLTGFPVWKQADGPLRQRLIIAAKQYVLDPPQLDTSWIGTIEFRKSNVRKTPIYAA